MNMIITKTTTGTTGKRQTSMLMLLVTTAANWAITTLVVLFERRLMQSERNAALIHGLTRGTANKTEEIMDLGMRVEPVMRR